MLASAHNEQRVGSVFVKQEAAKEDEELKFVSLSFFHWQTSGSALPTFVSKIGERRPENTGKHLVPLSGLLSPISPSANGLLTLSLRSTTMFWSLDVSAKSKFSQDCRNSASWSLGLLYNLWNCRSSFFHSHKARSSSLTFFHFAHFLTLDVLMIYLWLKMVYLMQFPGQKTCGTGILVINSDKLIEMPILIWCF